MTMSSLIMFIILFAIIATVSSGFRQFSSLFNTAGKIMEAPETRCLVYILHCLYINSIGLYTVHNRNEGLTIQ
jgi:hypothetical protein